MRKILSMVILMFPSANAISTDSLGTMWVVAFIIGTVVMISI